MPQPHNLGWLADPCTCFHTNCSRAFLLCILCFNTLYSWNTTDLAMPWHDVCGGSPCMLLLTLLLCNACRWSGATAAPGPTASWKVSFKLDWVASTTFTIAAVSQVPPCICHQGLQAQLSPLLQCHRCHHAWVAQSRDAECAGLPADCLHEQRQHGDIRSSGWSA